MTSIPVDRPTEDDPTAVVELSPTRARTQARAHASAHGGALTAVPGTAGVRFPSSAVRDLVQPPDVWSDPRPSLRSVWLYAVYGQWTGEQTAARRAGAVYAALVAVPVTAVGYLLLWVVERPSRLAVAAVLTVLSVLVLTIG